MPNMSYSISTEIYKMTICFYAVKLSLCFKFGHISRCTWVSRYQNVSILDIVGAKGDGGSGDSWRHKMCKVPVKLLETTNKPTMTVVAI